MQQCKPKRVGQVKQMKTMELKGQGKETQSRYFLEKGKEIVISSFNSALYKCVIYDNLKEEKTNFKEETPFSFIF